MSSKTLEDIMTFMVGLCYGGLVVIILLWTSGDLKVREEENAITLNKHIESRRVIIGYKQPDGISWNGHTGVFGDVDGWEVYTFDSKDDANEAIELLRDAVSLQIQKVNKRKAANPFFKSGA